MASRRLNGLSRHCANTGVRLSSLFHHRYRAHSSPAGKEGGEITSESEALAFLAERSRALRTPLTLAERKLIVAEIGLATGDAKLRQSEWERLVSRRSFEERERLTLSDFLAKSHDGFIGQKMLQRTARCGVAFFALAGAHTAGEHGMHVFGSALVGSITALGGGTINGLLVGATPVGWVRDPTFLLIAGGASLLGFYGWPLVEQLGEGADAGVVAGSSRIDGHAGDETEVAATGASSQKIEPSAIRYGCETVALGSLAVVGAQQGIVRGLHPLVSASLGVTIALGGVMRDVMCKRDLALGAVETGCQSYGIASFSGAAVYVALRELHVWNCAGSASKLLHGGIPIGLRIFLGFGTVFAVRAAAWVNKPDGMLQTMDESAKVNRDLLRRLEQSFRW